MMAGQIQQYDLGISTHVKAFASYQQSKVLHRGSVLGNCSSFQLPREWLPHA